MTSILESFQNRMPSMPLKDELPVSNQNGTTTTTVLRRRISSVSMNRSVSSSSGSGSDSDSASWTFPGSKSFSSMGGYAGSSVRSWWDWGWSWILSGKPIFGTDLEMNEDESRVLGLDNKGSWRHVVFKVRSEIRRFTGSDSHQFLPQTNGSFNHTKSFQAC